MKKHRVLALVDHSRHQKAESIYALLQQMKLHPACGEIHVASRGVSINEPFFWEQKGTSLQAIPVDDQFHFDPTGTLFQKDTFEIDVRTYDAVLLRMRKPNPYAFFHYLESLLSHTCLINRPSGILTCGPKSYLVNFPDLCPPSKLCFTVEEAMTFAQEIGDIVLKPQFEAGGKGLIRIMGDKVMVEREKMTLAQFLPQLQEAIGEGYLAMEFLRHNDQGDKRVLVSNGAIVGAVLRIPAKGNWLCNMSQGAQAVAAEVDEDEEAMAARLIPALKAEGVVLFGYDTLMGNHGKRVLSEINASNSQGFYPAELLSGKPVTSMAAAGLWEWIIENG